MKLSGYLSAVSLFASLAVTASSALPEAFQGRWNTTCAHVDDVDFIEMSDQVFGYWEETCAVTDLSVLSATHISVHLQCRQNDGAQFAVHTGYQIIDGKLHNTSTQAPAISRIRCGQ